MCLQAYQGLVQIVGPDSLQLCPGAASCGYRASSKRGKVHEQRTLGDFHPPMPPHSASSAGGRTWIIRAS